MTEILNHSLTIFKNFFSKTTGIIFYQTWQVKGIRVCLNEGPHYFKVYYIFTSSKNSSVSYEQKNVQRVIVIDLDRLREFRATGKKMA